MKWELQTYKSEFVTPWKISGAEVSSKDIFLIKFINGDYCGYGEITYGSKENIEFSSLQEDLDNFFYIYKDAKVVQFNDMTRLLDTVDFINPRIRFAIESAFIDYLHTATDISPWKILGTNTVKSVESVQSISIFSNHDEGKILMDGIGEGIVPKFKISKETADVQIDFLNTCERAYILDANESWGSDVEGLLKFLKKVDQKQVLFIEQPLERSALQEYRRLKLESPIQIFLDESIQDHKHLSAFVELCHGVVLKSSKANSLMRIVMQMTQAKKLGLKTMLGCMVESSVGISSLFPVSYGFDYYDFDGFTKIKEDKFSRVFWDNGKVALSSMN